MTGTSTTTKAPATRAAKPQLAGTIPTKLEDIGPYVKARHKAGEEHAFAVQDALLDIGVALNKARQILRSDKAYGEWFQNQQFPFSTRWGNTLQRAGAAKPKVQKALKAQTAEGDPLNFKAALQVAEGKIPAPGRNQVPTGTPEEPGEPAKAAPVPVTEPAPAGRLNDEWVQWLIAELEENLLPRIEKGAADGVDKATGAALEGLGQVFFEMSQLCEKVAGAAADEDDE
jgi:hypothetical protein